MSWDERLFDYLYRLARRAQRPAPDGVVVALEPLRERLQLLAGLLSGAPLCLGRLRLPAEVVMDTAEQGAQLYVYRVALEAFRLREGIALPASARTAEQRLVATLDSLPGTWRALEAELPGCAALRQALAGTVARRRPAARSPRAAALEEQVRRTLLGEAASWGPPAWDALPGGPMPEVPEVLLWGELGAAATLGPARIKQAPPEALPSGTERQGKAPREARTLRLPEDPEGENPLVHVFEKVRTAEEHRGGRKTIDGSDELEEQLAALEELDLRQVLRSHQAVRSIYRAELPLPDAAPDLQGEGGGAPYCYDEWDEGIRGYRRGHCQVFAAPPPQRLDEAQTTAYVRGALRRQERQVRDLRLALLRIAREHRWRSRCGDGPEVDIDALVDRHGALRAGHCPPDKLYLARRPRRPRLAALVLIDSSLSTDSWVAGRRVLDVARESVLALGEVLCGLLPAEGGQVGIGAFYSNTRRDCRYVEVKGFEDPWTLGQRRVAQLQPAGYTRIGPALRHGLMLLDRVPARRRLLLLLSDGKPTDYDRYEGAYGMADVQQALREAQQRQVLSFALAIDAQARGYLPRMLGAGNYEILSAPEQLTAALLRLFSRLLR